MSNYTNNKSLLHDLIANHSDETYVVFTRSRSFMGRLIHRFSKLSKASEEFDHCVLVRQGMEVHMTAPRVEYRPFETRDYMKVYKVTGDAWLAFERALKMWQNDQQYQKYLKDKRRIDKAFEQGRITGEQYRNLRGKPFKYGHAQLVSQAFTLLFNVPPIRARMQCIEFVMRALGYVPNDVDSLTVGEGCDRLVVAGYIEYLGKFT